MLDKVIGNTPMVKIDFEYLGKKLTTYVKLEMFNLTGSIKDRVAYYMLKNGNLKEGAEIVEATSGNTGISLAALGAFYNHKVHIFMPDWASVERRRMMEGYGAELTLISREDGGFSKCLEEAKKYALKHKAFYPDQFSNENNILAHYDTTGAEILRQLPEKIGGFVSGVGTGGTLLGTSKRLKERYPDMITCAIEPENMPLISGGKIKGAHKIEGIGDDFIPKLVDKNLIDKIFLINDEDAMQMARIISRKLGIGVGISSGANFIGSALLGSEIMMPVATVFADDNKKYVSTDLFKDENLDDNLISNNIKILGASFIK
ncbi:MAG TPA: PLP-dependent cysteine synthase family protein [Candidatus Coprosoma intestinipullorum]|uniref:cysteine synthase n=1 Tax=Candidatus Coprosoma intestinipullorum TaxID=2840752 RepID=A0A9D0ZSV8_9FIRM|nr:PLP-dependent cysteine synthase family protein [Candidatus Coprosoma intestinipullorum]